MVPSVKLPPGPRLCPQCGEVLDLKSPHVEISGSAVRVYCSNDCRRLALTAAVVLPPPAIVAEPRRSRSALRLGLVVMVGGLLVLGGDAQPLIAAGQLRAAIADVRAAIAARDAEPELDPEAVAAAEAAAERARWTAALSNNRWVHPLAGPKRRMPIRVSRVFGADRPGHRPVECEAGHCGVDIGGEVWGEPVLAAHDGVVARTQRNPNHANGGMYIKLSHRDGTVFTQYFHLAAIPKSLRVGDEVRAGQVIGLLGATGIRYSEAHLHFTVSVRSNGEGPEQYIDPEPLIALWPVAIPVFGDVGSIARTHTIPGHPAGPYGKKRHKKRPEKKKKKRARKAEKIAREEPAEPDDSGDQVDLAKRATKSQATAGGAGSP